MTATTTEIHSISRDPRLAITQVIDQHGAWRVLRAALLALAAKGPGPHAPAERWLNDHLRRDIGLPPAPPRPPDIGGRL